MLSLPSDRKFVQFTYASFGSPAISTYRRAIRKGYLSTIPRLTSALFGKHTPNSVATAMGHLDRRRQGLDSTKKVLRPPTASSPVIVVEARTYEDDINNMSEEPPATSEVDTNVYTKLCATADFDATGRLPGRYAYHLVSCYNGNIHVEAMQSRTSTSYIDAYDKTFLHWAQYGHVPSIVRLDAETSVALEQFLLNDKHVTSFQYFPTGTHRANRAERCIRTWKNHFIATLATASPKFPITHWHKLIPLAELTLNCLRLSQLITASLVQPSTSAPTLSPQLALQFSSTSLLKNAVHGQVTECPAITSVPPSSIIGLTTSSRQLPQHLASPTPSHGFPRPTSPLLYLTHKKL